MTRTLEALSQWFAVIDPATGRVDWCTQALQRRYPHWFAGRQTSALADEFAGLKGVLDRVRRGPVVDEVLTAPDGRPVGVDAAADPDGTVHLHLQDLWQQRQAITRHLNDREQLLFVSRSLSVGEMASTLAHELNQPIGAITNLLRGLANRLERNTLEPETARSAIQRGIDQALYAAGIIARVREYVQHRQPKEERIPLATLVGDSVALLDWEIQRDAVLVDIALDKGIAAGDRTTEVAGDRVMLQQVLVNLVRNAIEAMRGVPAGERRLRLSSTVDDGMAVLSISDNGVGISDEVAERMFTAFFTTKPEGMGVGLHLCRSIIELQQGRLWFTREPAPGCTFHVALPLAAEQQESIR